MKKFKHKAVALGIAMALSGTAYADLNDGLVAYYPFDGNANDESGNGNHGVEYGDTHYTNGMIKQARLFDREDGLEYILIPNTLNSNEYSVALWANLEEISSHHSVLMLNSTSSWAETDFWLFTSHERVAVIQNRIDLRYDSYNSTFMSSNKLESNTNYFIVANYQNRQITLYVNGEFYAEYGDVAPIQNNPTDLNIGISPSGTGQYQINGLIDDLRIYNRALSESEIQQLYQPCQPTIDIVLNSNNRVTGDRVIVNTQINGPGILDDRSCEPSKVVETVWVKLPDDSIIPLIKPFTSLTLLPGDEIDTKIFEYTFSGVEPIGSYQIGGRLLHPFSGDAISTDIEVLTFIE